MAMANVPEGLAIQHGGEKPTAGVVLREAYDCWYPPHVQRTDLLQVDFGVRSIQDPGLYLVEEPGGDGVVWRGCRLFARASDNQSVRMDATGDGDWVGAGQLSQLRVVGRVRQVFRPVCV